jgi:hypothetical protein
MAQPHGGTLKDKVNTRVHARIEKFTKREAVESRVIMAVLRMAQGA